MRKPKLLTLILTTIITLSPMADVTFADDISADDWVTNSGDTYITSGNVGIGRQNPLARLHVKDNLLLLNETIAGNTNLFINRPNSGNAQIIFGYYTGLSDTHPKIKYVGNGDLEIWNGTHFIIRNTTQKHFIVNADNGNVGIGTTTPDHKLVVKGTIRASEIKVDNNIAANEFTVRNSSWSDFVFEDEYNLPTLPQVESFIKENKHLPDIPSANEVKKEGLSMAEMMKKQMQKIEELTLYVIELKKENESQNRKIAVLENELVKKK